MEPNTALNFDIRSLNKVIGTTVANLGIGATPVGMRRYITLVSLNNIAGQENTIYLCSAAGSANTSTNALASAAAKFSKLLETGETCVLPEGSPIPTVSPLFSIAASQFLNAKCNKGQVRAFIQYYDK